MDDISNEKGDSKVATVETTTGDNNLSSRKCITYKIRTISDQMAVPDSSRMVSVEGITPKKQARRNLFTYEQNPIRRRHIKNRLFNKIQKTIDEYVIRTRQQAVFLGINPNMPETDYKVCGSESLVKVVNSLHSTISNELNGMLDKKIPPPPQGDTLFDLPPLLVDGNPTSVDHMTVAQLRTFITRIVRICSGRGKVGWGKELCKPPWWPRDLPWHKIWTDTRPIEMKKKYTWKQMLRQVVKNCYLYHGREDLLLAFQRNDEGLKTAPVLYTYDNAEIISPVFTLQSMEDNNNLPTLTSSNATTIEGSSSTCTNDDNRQFVLLQITPMEM